MRLQKSSVRKQGLFLAFVLLVFGVCFSSCASSGAVKYRVYVTNTKKVSLLPTRYMTDTLDAFELFSGTFGDVKFSMQSYIYSDKNEIQVVLLNDFGTDMGSLYYADSELTLDSAVFPSALKPEYIVADFQNAFYDTDALSANYSAAKLLFTVQVLPDGTEVRKILNKNSVIEEIQKSGASVTIKNYLRGYTYVLTKADE